MKLFRHLLIACISLLTLAGCAPIITSDFPKPPEGPTAAITVYRESVFYGGGAVFPIILDGREVAQIRMKDRLEFKVTPGSHSIGAGTSSFNFQAEAGKFYYVSVTPKMNGGCMILLKTDAEAALRIDETTRLND